jgi:multidrug efflux system outer membrane protein
MTGWSFYRCRPWSLVAIATMLAGCTVGPDYEPKPIAAPAAWTTAAPEKAAVSELAGWWKRFDDPVLDRLVAQALAANGDLVEAAAKLREARAGLAKERAAQFPMVDASGSATRSRQATTGTTGSMPGADQLTAIVSNAFQAGFDVSFELDIFGGQRRAVESAAASTAATEADLGGTVLSLLGDVARYYVEARAYAARITVAKDTLASRTDTWHLTEAKARGGTGTGLDATQARAEMESAAAAIPPLEYDLRAAMERLAVLTGQQPQAVLAIMGDTRSVPRLAGSIVPDPPVVALARRPDIQAAERRIAAATADIGVAQADRLPAVTLDGSVGLNSSRLRSVFKVSSNVWSFGPEVSLPIFDAGSRAAKVDQKVAIRDQKIAAWQTTVRNAVEEAENALAALDRERAHNTALRRTVDAYAEARAVAQARYDAGLADLLNVLDADRSLANARDSLVQSDAALATDGIALYKALGGGWEDDTTSLVRSASRSPADL